ncbi:MAG: hypothetical protein AB1512_26680 [Thermodesulfobacteriota bacterium]
MKPSQRLSLYILVALSALTLWAYWGVQQNGFVGQNGHDHVVHNRDGRDEA